MRKILPCLLIFAFCTSFCGCEKEPVKIEKPVNLYYRQSQISYGSADGVIGICITEGAGFENDLLGLLNLYLRNTTDPAFSRTFPDGSQLVRLTVQDGAAQAQLNNQFSRAAGIDLTIACACLSLTIMELTSAESVTISAFNATLDGAESITMTTDSILLLDLLEEPSDN